MWGFKQGREGVAALPNLGFWQMVGGLVVDGLIFTSVAAGNRSYDRVGAAARKPVVAAAETAEEAELRVALESAR